MPLQGVCLMNNFVFRSSFYAIIALIGMFVSTKISDQVEKDHDSLVGESYRGASTVPLI